MVSSALVLAALGCASSAYAGIAGGPQCPHRNQKRNMRGDLKWYTPRQATASQAAPSMPLPTDEASGAISEDPTYECTPYSFAKVLEMEPHYPGIWDTAYIMPGDTEAMEIFAQINQTVNEKVPNDLPHGTPNGDFQGVNYNNSDPDCWWTWKQCTAGDPAKGIPADITTVPEPNTWGLAFDDGPNCSHNALYDMLWEKNQKATMFYIGSNVMDWPLQALRGIDDGHEICVHTWSHQYMTAFSNEVAFAELYYARQAIKELLGVTPKCWRPPYGDVDNRIRVIADGLNLTTIVWDQDTSDWKVNIDGVTAQDIDNNYETFIEMGRNGSWATKGTIVLNHELTNFTMSEMMKYYDQITQAFKAVVPIQAAYNITNPYAEGNVTMPDFAQYVAGDHNATTMTGSHTNTAAYTDATGAAMSSTMSSASVTGSAAASGTARVAAAQSSTSSKKGAGVMTKEIGGGLSVVAGLMGLVALL